MKIHFKIHFITQWGQSIVLLVKNDNHDTPQRIEMNCGKNFEWTAVIDIHSDTKELFYRYALENDSSTLEFEYGDFRQIKIDTEFSDVYISDNWRARYGDSPFESSAFTDCLFKRNSLYAAPQVKDANLVLRLRCAQLEPNRHFAVIGNQDALGNWDVAKKIRLDESDFPVCSVALNATKFKFPLEYKYLIVDTATDEVLAWGGGPNRVVESVMKKSLNIVNDEHFIRTIPSWKGAGVAIPVFSLRSEESCGIGEFYDLKKMVDWAKKTGQRIIQTLPINDTILYHTNYDSYPYNAVSVYALHPIYLHLESMGTLNDELQKKYFEDKKKEFNAKTFSDYQNVMNLKWEYFEAIYQQEKATVFASESYLNFFVSNKSWLIPYAAFSFLRDFYGTPDFRRWEKYSRYEEQEILEFSDPKQPHYDQLAIYYYLQYHLHCQLSEVRQWAHENGVVIKGDIPIGVSPFSVDVWINPELFNTQVQAGAPPDDFSLTGQNWGFPTYNWEEMEKDDFLWWKKRFQKLSEYFDAYRIDHILGFFRIWEIPADDVWGLTGSFHPALPFTRQELEAKGLRWDESRYLEPYLKEHVLYATFGKYADDVIREFFVPHGWKSYKFKPEYDTQKKVEAYFNSLGYNFSNKDVMIRDGLYSLHCEVLFVRDLRQPEKFHPRIAMHSTASFRDLPDETRRTLDRIYVDFFYHRHNEFWKQQAMKKLPALITATSMLPCGEDLGMVPDSVPEVMQILEILSLEVQRMPKKPNMEFGMPSEAPYLSVCTTSTHDMNPLRAWWEEDSAVTQRFYNHALGLQGAAPKTCETWIVERIVQQHLQSKAMWVILPWQDWMALDEKLRYEHPFAERINVPSNPRNFWCYRMHLTLEKLLSEDDFNQYLFQLISQSGR
ncbi:MAG TPA: 4-alpha-glucanotransferase, partial [Paludibacteraceae bacterium]|nr:4-alpha-glucanotransferase [Paludibacteraceae bacterium]HOR39906.1 4-alpha-glucanotransferase [Paludibacteraceae bacterium]